MTRSYEDLEGGFGAAVFYRAPRYRPKAVFGEEKERLLLGSLRAKLADISLTGAACFLDANQPSPEKGSVLQVKLWLSDALAFEGAAEVVRAEEGRAKIAVRFLDSLFDTGELHRLKEGLRFRRALQLGIKAYAAVPEAYTRALSNVILFLRHWKLILEERERTAGLESEALTEMEFVAEEHMRVEWRNVRALAIEAMPNLECSPDILSATKRYTESLVTPLLVEAPIWHRAYVKPLGYPGDYVLMNYMYDDRREGSSAYARILHQLGKEERLAATVAARRDLLVRLIRETLSVPGEQARVTSLGAGPAREIEDFLASAELQRRVVFTLIDQDESALRFAEDRLLRQALRHSGLVKVRCRQVSFKNLFGDTRLLLDLSDQDLVYSAGFFDYLQERVARRLLAALLRLVRPGGLVAVGNAANEPDVIWVPEFVLDWRMKYRTEEDMRELAELPLEGLSVALERDASKAWLFLMVRRHV
jgi:SAM-dependent methyltransferase